MEERGPELHGTARVGDVIEQPEPIYIAAREVLLDALEALSAQLDAIVMVGAQAVYLRTGEANIAVAPYTTDTDVVLDLSHLDDAPTLVELLNGADFDFSEEHPANGSPRRKLRARASKCLST